MKLAQNRKKISRNYTNAITIVRRGPIHIIDPKDKDVGTYCGQYAGAYSMVIWARKEEETPTCKRCLSLCRKRLEECLESEAKNENNNNG